ncbi:hypothetical protein Tco_0337488 [Tanacetum coccineum]
MSRANPQALIVFEEQLVPSANRLTIKKNNQRVASDSNITGSFLRLVVGILRHHKLYKPVSLTATVPVIYLHQFWTTITHNSNSHTFNFQLDIQTYTLTVGLLRNVLRMPPLDANKPYTKPPTKKQILAFIKKLGKDTSWDTARLLILQILWGIVHSANLDFASLIRDEFEWQAVDRTTKQTKMSKLMYTHFTKLIIDHFLFCNKSIPRRLDSELHSEGQDSPLTKLTNTVVAKFKFGMEIPDTMINDAIKQSAGYKYYKHKRNES